jgi:hypothetical protein
MKHKQNRAPAAKAGSAGEYSLADSQRRNSLRRPRKKLQKCYWLHVTDDGREKHFVAEPTHVLTLRVQIIKVRGSAATERTWTRRVPASRGSFDAWTTVAPRGEGWSYEAPDDQSDKWLRVRQVGGRGP